ncbi:hypothetical protein [Bacillus sp. AK128]
MSSCNDTTNNSNTAVLATTEIQETVKEAFRFEDIELIESDKKSKTFDYSITEEINYKFDGGTVYVFYGFESKNDIKKKIESTFNGFSFRRENLFYITELTLNRS